MQPILIRTNIVSNRGYDVSTIIMMKSIISLHLCVPMDLLVFIKIIVGEHSGLSVVTGAFPKKRSWKMLNGLIICL